MGYVYVDDGSAVPADVRVFEDPEGFLQDKNHRKITRTLDSTGITNPQGPSPVMDALGRIEAKIDQLLAK